MKVDELVKEDIEVFFWSSFALLPFPSHFQQIKLWLRLTTSYTCNLCSLYVPQSWMKVLYPPFRFGFPSHFDFHCPVSISHWWRWWSQLKVAKVSARPPFSPSPLFFAGTVTVKNLPTASYHTASKSWLPYHTNPVTIKKPATTHTTRNSFSGQTRFLSHLSIFKLLV